MMEVTLIAAVVLMIAAVVIICHASLVELELEAAAEVEASSGRRCLDGHAATMNFILIFVMFTMLVLMCRCGSCCRAPDMLRRLWPVAAWIACSCGHSGS